MLLWSPGHSNARMNNRSIDAGFISRKEEEDIKIRDELRFPSLIANYDGSVMNEYGLNKRGKYGR